MSLEHPEAIFAVTPAEGQRPLFIMTDPSFEAMFNSDKFCSRLEPCLYIQAGLD